MKFPPSTAAIAFALLGATACVPEQGQVAPPVAQAANAPSAAAVNASVQRALGEAEKARAAAQRAEEAAQRGQNAAAQAQALAPRPADLDPRLAFYQGERTGGATTSHGVTVYPDGGRYEGQVVGTARNGSGVYIGADRTRYAGEWRDDRMTGHGSATRPGTRARYDGEWQAARRHGHGVQIDDKGERYAGEFREGRPHGLGVLFDAKGQPRAAGMWGPSGPSTAAMPAASQAPAPAPAPAPASFGTGFAVNARGAILTNEHVVRGCTRIEVREEDGGFAPARLVRADAGVDLALLDLGRPTPAFAALRDSGSLREGEEIVVFGFPFAAEVSPGGTVTSGLVSSLFGPRGATHQLQITAPIQIGNSGGPVLDRQGRVVAIVQSKLNALSVARVTGDLPQNVNFAVKSAPAFALLREAGVAPTAAPTQAPDQRIADIVEAAKRWTLLVRCQR
jgi:S1-C subfamily serine protease